MIIFHVCFVSFCVLVNGVTYPTSDAFFAVDNISASVNSSNFNFVFFKVVCHSNPLAERKRVGPRSNISIQFLQKLSNISANDKHGFERTNHDIHPNILFENLSKVFLYVGNPCQQYLLSLSYHKIPFSSRQYCFIKIC